MKLKLHHWFFFIFLLALDQITKLVAHLQGLVVLNPGVSFGLLFAVPQQVLTGALLIVLLIGVFLWSRYLSQYTWESIWFFAGGMSNLVDRLLVGAVRDWLYVPILGNKNNLADWYIAISVGLLLVHSYMKSKKEARDV